MNTEVNAEVDIEIKREIRREIDTEVNAEVNTEKKQNKDSIDYVIYHKNCSDGFGAAFAVWYWFKLNYPEKLGKINFEAAMYNQKEKDIRGKNILVVDFSFKEETTRRLIENNESLLVIDHHETGVKNLENIGNEYKIFDMKHSGAYLTWCYFFGNKNVPLMIKLIEDRDIWTKKIYGCDEFAAILMKTPFKFEEYEKFLNEDEINKSIERGSIIRCCEMEHIEKMCKYVSVKLAKIKEKYYFIAYMNTNFLKSDVANHILKVTHPYVDFAAIYNYDELTNKTIFSLRSLHNTTNVSQIAEFYGGGGHVCASSFSLNDFIPHLPGTVNDKNNVYYDIFMKHYTIPHSDHNFVYLPFDYFLLKSLLQTNPELHGYHILKHLQQKYPDTSCFIFYHHILSNPSSFSTSFMIFPHQDIFDSFPSLLPHYSLSRSSLSYSLLLPGVHCSL